MCRHEVVNLCLFYKKYKIKMFKKYTINPDLKINKIMSQK